jgi:2-deoxy-D-gluconate 3-dehydrogenase
MRQSDFSLAGRVALVTGAASGIGQAIALGMAGAGADVALDDIDGEGLKETAAGIDEVGRESLSIVADVGTSGGRKKMVEAATSEFGRIDILVNSAADAPQFTPAYETNEEDWDRTMNAGLKGLFFLSLAVARAAMIPAGKGVIINISSNSAYQPVPLHAAYGIMKAGVNMTTQVLASELAPHGIRVNGIAPRLVKNTRMVREHWEDPERLKRAEAKAALGYVPVPDDLAGVAVFLASDASSYYTGQTMLYDGGMNIGIL